MKTGSRPTAIKWWHHALARWRDGESTGRRDIDHWLALSPADRQRIQKRLKAGLHSQDARTRELAGRILEDIAAVEMGGPTISAMSEHLQLEVAAVFWRRGQPLAPEQPVPGCGCPNCTGIAADSPARPQSPPHRQRFAVSLDLDAARAVPITTVAQMLGLEPDRSGRRTRCPFHDDAHPSLDLRPDRGNRAYCAPCGKSWDGIGLVMELRAVSFVEAVGWLVQLVGSRP